MKNIFAALLAVIAAILISTTVFAAEQTGTVGNCTYRFNDSTGILSLMGDGEMGIPGYTYNNRTDIKRVYISTGITDISPYAFYGCKGLETVTITSTVTKIGRYAFEFDSNLVNVNFPEGLKTIDTGAFYGCTSLSDIKLSSSVTTINDLAFANTGVEKVSIPPNVTSLGTHSIGFTYKNSTYTPVNNFTVYAVSNTSGATFAGTNNFTTYKTAWSFDDLTGTITLYGNGAMNLPTNTFNNRTDIKNVVISEGLTNITSNIFYGCSAVRSVKLPGTLTSIGTYTFGSAVALTDINFPQGLKTISSAAFYGCTKLTNVNLPRSLTTLGSSAFAQTGLKKILIPPGVTSIGNYAVGYNYTSGSYSKVSDFTIYGASPSTAKTYADNNGITFAEPKGSTGSCTWKFDATTGTLTISGSGKMADYTAYTETPWYTLCGIKAGIKKVVIESGVTNVGNYAFDGCSYLKELSLPETVTSIGIASFRETGLVVLETPASLKSISPYAFRNCTDLERVDVHYGLTDISYYAFYGDTSLKYFIVPDKIITTGNEFIGGLPEGFRLYSYADVNGLGSYAKKNGYVFIIMGNIDLDSENKISDADAALLLKYLSGTENLSEEQLIAARITDSSKEDPDMRDVIAILRKA